MSIQILKRIRVKNTNKHDFDPKHVLRLLESNCLPHEDAKRILDNACSVIVGLRHDLKTMHEHMEQRIKLSKYWLNE
jgi:hypothetical protein